MITHTLRQTIYIDFDKIEASTTGSISEISGLSTPRHVEPAKDREEGLPLRQQLASLGGSEAFADGTHYDGHGLHFDLENEADKMLEQAEALPAEITWDSLLDLSDSE